jgi:RNA polymerase sigma-70 factor (ECF subfamily)
MTAPHFDLWLRAHFRSPDDDTPVRGERGAGRRTNGAVPAHPRDAAAGDASIVEAVRRGDATRFAEWYEATYDDAWRFAHRFVHDSPTASDVVHDVFLAIWKGRATWVVRGSLHQYVLGAVRHRALNTKRHERIAERHAKDAVGDVGVAAPGMSAALPATDDAAAEARLREILRREIDVLPERQRTALVLRWDHGLSNAEIAGVLSVGEAAVSRLLGRATETLRAVWERLAE